MDDPSPSLILIALFVILNILISLAYAALSNIREGSIRDEAESGNSTAQHIVAVLNAKPQMILTYILGSMLSQMLVATLVFQLAVERVTLLTDTTANILALAVLCVLATSFVLTLFANMVPESVGTRYNMSIARVLILPFRLIMLLLSPFSFILTGLSHIIASAFGSSDLVNVVTEEEIKTLIDAGHTGGTIEDEEKAMIYSVLKLDETNAREIMTPRPDLLALDVTTPINEALEQFISSGYSRIPIYEENVDNIIGLLYAKDLLSVWHAGDQKPIRDIVRPAYFVPEVKTADELLRELQNRKVHMAIVVDEYGGTSGIVTIENLIEEIVGDIRDEYDVNEESEFTKLSDEQYIIDGGMNLDDVNDMLETSLSQDDTDTLGGFIFMTLGHVAKIGEEVETDELTLRVHAVEGRRIRKIMVTRKQPEQTRDDNDAQEDGQSKAIVDENR